MARHETRHMGDGGEIVIPKDMRERLGIGPGDEVTFEERAGEVVILGKERGGRSESSGRGSARSSARSSSSGGSSSEGSRSHGRSRDCF